MVQVEKLGDGRRSGRGGQALSPRPIETRLSWLTVVEPASQGNNKNVATQRKRESVSLKASSTAARCPTYMGRR